MAHKDPEKLAAYKERKRLRNKGRKRSGKVDPEKAKAAAKARYEANKDALKARSRDWYQNNRDKAGAWYQANKERIAERAKERERRLRLENPELVRERDRKKHRAKLESVRAWYRDLKAGLRCERCPETEPLKLHFHHRDPSTKVTEVSDMIQAGRSRQRILDEIAKCAVLCNACHQAEHKAMRPPSQALTQDEVEAQAARKKAYARAWYLRNREAVIEKALIRRMEGAGCHGRPDQLRRRPRIGMRLFGGFPGLASWGLSPAPLGLRRLGAS
jgi:hypothetical protein